MAKSTRTSDFGVSKREGHDASKFYASNVYKSEKLNLEQDLEEFDFPKDLENQILCKSSEDMHDLPNGCVDLMVTSPPYNVGKQYDNDLSLFDYLLFLHKVFSETYRVLINGGRACINVANVGRKPYVPLSDYVSFLMRDIGFNQRGEIIWDKGASAGTSCSWGSWKSASNPSLRDIHEYILIFSKGNLKKEKGEKENTITRDEFIEYTKSIWKMNTVSAKKIGHPAPFPVELPRRLIQLYSYKGDIVLDPFMGSGQTAIASKQSDRIFIGYDNDESYVELANKRLVEIS